MRIWLTQRDERYFRDSFAWYPVRALDEYTGRWALVWLCSIRKFNDGRVTFSSFYI